MILWSQSGIISSLREVQVVIYLELGTENLSASLYKVLNGHQASQLTTFLSLLLFFVSERLQTLFFPAKKKWEELSVLWFYKGCDGAELPADIWYTASSADLSSCHLQPKPPPTHTHTHTAERLTYLNIILVIFHMRRGRLHTVSIRQCTVLWHVGGSKKYHYGINEKLLWMLLGCCCTLNTKPCCLHTLLNADRYIIIHI